MLLPKIVFNNGSGLTTLNFTYPPVEKPGVQDGTSDEREANRVDSITMTGRKQVFYVRTDIFRVLTMKNVPMADLTAWSQFIDIALTGTPFDYYPDKTLGTFTTYTLEDTNWQPKYSVRNLSQFSLKLRLYVP
jgi:hypothetical protein